MDLTIRRIEPEDVDEVVALSQRTIRISNSKDYPEDLVSAMAEAHTPDNEHIVRMEKFRKVEK